MHVRELTLTNVRQFEHRTYAFQPGFNLLVGKNGAGKTTLLRALLAVLGSAKQTGRRPALLDDDIRLHTNGLQISAKIADNEGNTLSAPRYVKQIAERARRAKSEWDPLVLLYASNEATCSSFVGRRIRRYSASFPKDTQSTEQFLYETERGADIEPDQKRGFGRSQAIRSFVLKILSTFSPEFRSFGWTFEPYDCSIRPPSSETKRSETYAQLRRTLAGAVMRHLQETREPYRWPDQARIILDSRGFLKVKGAKRTKRIVPELSELLRTSKPDKPTLDFLSACTVDIRLTPRIMVHSRQGELQLSQLSDGEKRLFSIFVDIARQLSIQRVPLRLHAQPAIVLIDEIDVHLHPEWQRKIVPALEDLFPACQFIATTHSPFVIQAVDQNKLTRVGVNVQRKTERSGNSIEDIIEEVQGVTMPQRSKRAEEMNSAAARYFTLLRRGDDVSATELETAEHAYRVASEPFTTEPGLNALLRLESIAAKAR